MSGRDAFAATAQVKLSSESVSVESVEETNRDFRLGGKLGQYELIRMVGEGGMGAVFEASHVRLGKRVAIKLLHVQFARNNEMTQRFLREGVVACQIGHPNIVDITDVGVHEGIPYLVMEFLEGDPLEERIYGNGRLEISTVADLMVPVVDAIAAAHEHGVIHRDIKPANIILARSRHGRVTPKVVDFGISRLQGGADLTQVTLVPGTPCYMAPELGTATDLRGDPKSDQFALGVTLYETIVGERPKSTGRDRVISLRALRPDVPAALEQAVMRAMHKDPERRFPTVRQLGEAILPFAGQAIRTTWKPAFGRGETAEHSASSSQRVKPVKPAPSRRTARPRPSSRRPSSRRRRRPSLLYTLMLLLLSAGVGILTVVAWEIWTSPEITSKEVQSTPFPPSADPDTPSSDPMTEQLPSEVDGEKRAVTRLEAERANRTRW
jgi:serine/threonine protein kinase